MLYVIKGFIQSLYRLKTINCLKLSSLSQFMNLFIAYIIVVFIHLLNNIYEIPVRFICLISQAWLLNRLKYCEQTANSWCLYWNKALSAR